jgi:hypothetical protein
MRLVNSVTFNDPGKLDNPFRIEQTSTGGISISFLEFAHIRIELPF